MATSSALRNAKGDDAAWQAIIDRRRGERMAKIDALPADLRECVHDYGWNVVNAFMLLGIKKSRHIRHLVETVLNEFSPTRGAGSNQGTKRAPGMPGTELPSEKTK